MSENKSKRKFYIFIALGVLFLVLISFAAFKLLSIGYEIYTEVTASEREISGAFEINADWKEFTPQPPLESERKIQYVGLILDGVKNWDEKDKRKLLSKDGSAVFIEVEVYDEQGNKYTLTPNSIGRYVMFGKPFEGDPLDAPSKEPDFPRDRKYTKIRIRSDKNIQCQRIVWGTYTRK